MALKLLEAPYDIAFSRNPINYSITTDNALSTEGLAIEVRLSFGRPTYIGIIVQIPIYHFNTIIQLPLTPDQTGKVSIDFKKILDSLVQFELPGFDLTGSITNAQTGLFYIAYREISAALPDGLWIEEQVRHTVIKGGLPYERWQGPNYFKNFDFAEKVWLTWQPSGRSCAQWEKMWLTYFHLQDADVRTKNIKVKIYYTDGTTDDTKSLLLEDIRFNKYTIVRFPTGVEQLGLHLMNPEKKIQSYEFQIGAIVNGVFNPVSPVYGYTLDYSPDYQQQQFNFFNSLGALDSVRITGEIEKTPEYTRDLAENNPSAGYYNDTNLVPMQFTQQVLEQVSFTGALGWMDNARQQDLNRDFLLSKGVFEIKYRRWWPVNITNKTTAMGALIANLRSIPLEWSYGFTNESYAPEWITISPNDEVCPIITNLRNTIVEDYNNLVEWDADADALSFVVQQTISNPDGSNTVKTFYATEKSYTIPACYLPSKVSVKAVCESSESVFSSPIDLPQQQSGSCPLPANVVIIKLPGFSTGHDVTWTADPTAIRYEVQVRKAQANGSSTYYTVSTTGNRVNLPGAIFINMYISVRAVCAGGDASPYTNEQPLA